MNIWTISQWKQKVNTLYGQKFTAEGEWSSVVMWRAIMEKPKARIKKRKKEWMIERMDELINELESE